MQLLSTEESGCSHSWHSSLNDGSPLLCLPASTRKKKHSVSFLSEIQNHSFSDHHACCIMLVFQPVWTLSVSDCAENSPPLPLPLTLREEIMSFQDNLDSIPHFLWYMTFLSWMETMRPQLLFLPSCLVWVCSKELWCLPASPLPFMTMFQAREAPQPVRYEDSRLHWSQEAGVRKWEISWNVRFFPAVVQ